jgi:hypothetical protein
MSVDPLLQFLSAFALALLFAGAALHKRGQPSRFRAQLAAYDLVPARGLYAVAGALPWLELATAGLLLISATRSLAGMLACGLLLSYALAIAINLLRGRRSIECGCGGSGQTLSWSLVLRNLLLVAVAALLTLPSTPRALDSGDAVALVLLLVTLLLTYAGVEQILRNASLMHAEAGNES